MKLQIGMRLPVKDSACMGQQKQNFELFACKRIENYRQVNELTQKIRIFDQNKQKLNNFFHEFDSRCKVEYQVVKPPSSNTIRKLQHQLQNLAYSQQALKKEQQFELNKDALLMTFNSNTQQKPQKAEQNIKNSTKSYFFQQKLKKIQKINSLISLNRNKSISSISSTSRRPGFITISKSIKRQSSLQYLSIRSSHNNIQQIPPLSTDRTNRQPSPITQQLQSSKQRIAKIRRELTQIYRHRGKQTQFRLKL